ncbi:MAG: S8 family serine peptidase [Chitinophagales bacterium]
MQAQLSHFLKATIIISTFLFSIHDSFSQSNTNKISISLNKVLKDPGNAARTNGFIPVLIRADVALAEKLITENQGIVKFKTKTIISASVNESIIGILNGKDFVYWIDCPTGKITPLNDVMVKQNNVDSAYFGMWPLEQGYDGSGVIVGIIDAPFNYSHGDFTDSSGNTRIKYLWDQNTDGTYPASFDYGNECDSTAIANGTCDHSDIDVYYSHGTGVAGTAAGSGNATGNYRGVAPNADLIFVSMDFGAEFLSNTVDAIAYVFEKADELGKPCVINTSFGSYAGSHDGQDITSQAIAELITAQPGRAVVSAAGNGGNAKIHVGYDVETTPQFTWFKKLSYLNAVYFQVWADSSDFAGVNFSISADDPSDYSSKGTTPIYNILTDYTLSGGMFDETFFDVYDGATFTGTVQTAAQLVNGTYFLEVYITPVNPAHYWRFTTSGNGKFDIWSTEGFTGYSNYVTTLPDALTLPDIVNYQAPNTSQTIVSNWQCLEEVITVGSYVNRDTMTNYYGVYPPLIDTVGQLFYSSSQGPTRDNRIKPDITATGARVLSSGSSIVTSWLIDLGVADYISEDGQHFLQNGTSFASPCVTGAVALYLQKNPIATHEDIKAAILEAARKDSFTGSALPDNRWGHGKLDVFRTLTGPWGCSADDYENPPQNLMIPAISPSSAFSEWDVIPNATGYQVQYKNLTTLEVKKKSTFTNKKILNGLSPSTTYSCRVRAKCETFGLSGWSDEIFFTTPALKDFSVTETLVNIYPNPANTTLNIDGLQPGVYTIEILNMMGESHYYTKTFVGTYRDIFTTDVTKFANGMYTLVITEPASSLSKQIVITR